MDDPMVPGTSRPAEDPASLLAGLAPREIRYLDPRPFADRGDPDPYLVCPNCGATMYERGCKLRCRCGYFLSCSDI